MLKRIHSRLAPLGATVLVWVLLVSWRPFFLGFYHDDWWSLALPVTATPLQSLIAADPTRTATLCVLWVLRAAFGANAMWWQLFAAVVDLASALTVAWFANELYRDRPNAAWIGACAGVFWLVTPWSLAFTAWPIMAMPLLSVPCLATSGALLARAHLRWERAAAAAAIYLLGCLFYEAIWFAWAPLAAMVAFRKRQLGEPIVFVGVYMAICLVGQAGLVGMNRLFSGAAAAKQVYADWPALLLVSAHALSQMEGVVGKFAPLACAALVVIAAAAVVRGNWRLSVSTLVLVMIALGGVATSAILHAFAGYAIEWYDVMARTSMAPTFWLCMALAALASCVSQGGRERLWTGVTAGALLAAILGCALLSATRSWASAWVIEQNIINRFPSTQAAALAPGSWILADIPRNENPRANFDAYWDISGAVMAKHPNLLSVLKVDGVGHVTVLRKPDFWTTWDGASLEQGWCRTGGGRVWALGASRVYLWTYPEPTLRVIAAPFRVAC